MSFFVILLLGFALMFVLIVLPQRRREAAQRQLLDGLAPGDYVVTAGGLYGTIVDLGDDDLGLEVAPDVEVRVARRSIGAVIPPDLIEDVEIGEDDEPEAVAATGAAPTTEPDGR